jgi:hypothetical protein
LVQDRVDLLPQLRRLVGVEISGAVIQPRDERGGFRLVVVLQRLFQLGELLGDRGSRTWRGADPEVVCDRADRPR